MFLQSNIVWKSSSSGKQRKRVLINAQRAYKALFAPLEPLNCTAPNRDGDPSAFICESLDSHVVNSISNVDDLMLTDECPYPLDQACPTVSSSGDVVP